jgi:hypothetical protein
VPHPTFLDTPSAGIPSRWSYQALAFTDKITAGQITADTTCRRGDGGYGSYKVGG